MSKVEIMNKMSRTFHKVGFKFKKHAPTLLVAGGCVGVVTSTVMACKATTKLSTILDESKDKIDQIHECAANEEFKAEHGYTDEDAKKDLGIVYANTGLKLVKLYGPAVLVGTASLAAILYSHRILSKRNVALAAAYTAVEKSFKDYRSRVVERFGSEIDRQLKYNIKAQEIEVIETDENGNEVVKKKTIEVVDTDAVLASEYSRFFDELSDYWENDPEYNYIFLKKQERYANEKLRLKGYLFLNDVYDMLGITRTKTGQFTGWVYDEEHPNGDNYISFGIDNVHRKQVREFVNGYEPSVLLDFNVDGNIIDLVY